MTNVTARFRVIYPGFSLAVALELPGRGVSAIFGPSGSGKTTCLRVIAGLEPARDVYIAARGDVWQDDAKGVFVPAHRRAVGFVFQDGGLFEHLTVRGNIEYGMRRLPPVRRRVSLSHVVDLLEIGELLERRPQTLSGGERQRVGMARALAVSPELLLLDEPLAALDARRKDEILPYLERLHGELEIPILYVSHAVDEVARLADHLVVLEDGAVTASGHPVDLLTRLDLGLAHGAGAGAVVLAKVHSHDTTDHLTRVEFSGGALWLPYHASAVGQPIRARIQARDVSLTLERQSETSILNILPVTIADIAGDGPGQVMVALDAAGTRLLARITTRSMYALNLATGMSVYAQIKGVAIVG